MAESVQPLGGPSIETEKVVGANGSTCHVVSLRGEFDLVVAPRLRDTLVESLNAIPRAVVIHFAGVTFMDSSILGALVVAARRARELGVALRLAEVPPVAERLLKLTAMTRFFSIHHDLPSALDLPPGRPGVGHQRRPIDQLTFGRDR